MPYYLYRVSARPFPRFEKLAEHDSFMPASRQAKALRAAGAAGDGERIKLMFAETELAAEDLLSQVREASHEGGDD